MTLNGKIGDALILLQKNESLLTEELKINQRKQRMLLEILDPRFGRAPEEVKSEENSSNIAEIAENEASAEVGEPLLAPSTQKEPPSDINPPKVPKIPPISKKSPKISKKLQKITQNCKKSKNIASVEAHSSLKIEDSKIQKPEETHWFKSSVVDALRSKSPHWMTVDGIIEVLPRELQNGSPTEDLRSMILGVLQSFRQKDHPSAGNIKYQGRGRNYMYRYVEAISPPNPN